MEEEKVILVNELDEQIGLMPKLEAHQKAVLHRAFSVFILNDKKEIMLQQRAQHKYHSPLLWRHAAVAGAVSGQGVPPAGLCPGFPGAGFRFWGQLR